MLNLKQLECACAVRQHGSVSAAARHLSMSQQALSKSIGSLEKNLGVELFARSYDGMTPRPEAISLLDGAQTILDSAASLEAAAQRKSNKQKSIAIGIEEGLLGDSMSPFNIEELLEFGQNLDTHEIEIVELPFNSVAQQVLMGSIDAGVTCEEPSMQYAGKTILMTPLKAVTPESFPIPEGKKIKWSDLEGYKIITMIEDFWMKERIEEKCLAAGFKPNFMPALSHFNSNLALVRSGNAICLCPDERRVRAYEEGGVRIYDFQDRTALMFSLQFIWRKDTSSLEELEELEELAEFFKNQLHRRLF